MILIQVAIYSVLGLTYLGLALGYIPGLRMNRATIALVGSAFLIALGAIKLQEAWDAIDATTIVFLLSIMVVNANLSFAGFFLRSLSVLLSFTRSPFGLVTVLTFGRIPVTVVTSTTVQSQSRQKKLARLKSKSLFSFQ